jgi:hypothetical protein
MFDPARMRRYRVQDRGRPEDLWQPLYDRVNIATTVPATANFFAIARGGTATLIRGTATASVNKTTRDTNLETVGQLPAKGFQAVGISQHFIPATALPASASTNDVINDVQQLLHGGYMVWKTGDKTILEMPLHLVPGLTRIQGLAASAITSNNAVDYQIAAQNGSERGMYILRMPVTFQPFDTFTVSYNWDGTITLIQSFDIQFFFHGLTRRPT